MNWVKNREKASYLPKREPAKSEFRKELSWQGEKLGKKLRKSQYFTQMRASEARSSERTEPARRKIG
ncbi:MAG TPA: hypothetical protein DHV88_02880 [Roseburia sp.]|nr:hypothetical protein [Roseburia sp.]